MKRITKIVMLIILVLTLTSCEGSITGIIDNILEEPEYRELFDQLCENNLERATTYMNNYYYGEYSYYVYERSEIIKEYGSKLPSGYEFLENKEIDRVIFYNYESDKDFYVGVEIIEFKSVEAAERVMDVADPFNVYFARYENILYYLDIFAPIFTFGYPYTEDNNWASKKPFTYSRNKEVLINFYELDYNSQTLIIPDNVKYISEYCAQVIPNIKEIICGESLEKIGRWSMNNNVNLECFIANEKLKVINRGALMNNPKLKTIKLNDGLEYIGEHAFKDCPKIESVVIPQSVYYIGVEAFSYGTLYCETKSKPSGWDENFAGVDAKVYWGNEWEYNDEGIPVPIE